MKHLRACFIVLSYSTVGLIACSPSGSPEAIKGTTEHIRAVTEAVDDAALRGADDDPGNWLTYGRNYAEDRYSALTQINKESVGDLGLAWTIDLGSKRGIQATPLVVDGIMFLTGPWSVVYAVDARKGQLIWTFDPEVPRELAPIFCCGVVNRGPALYKGNIFIGTLDGRLVSIDAADGSLNWETRTVPEGGNYSITGAPRIANGKVLIGNAGAEMNVRGYVSAYGAETGELSWRFYTVPGDPKKPHEHPDLAAAAETWTGEWWKQGGGGTAWDTIVFDPELNLVYIGVGNGSHWNREIRSPGGGDNLYLSSIVAVHADSGEYVWHYQTTPGESWDYTATQPIILADLEVDGETRKVLMQAPKNGFFYVIDRETGELLSAEAYAYMNWATGIDDSGRPIETEGARYLDGKTHWISPGSHGAHNWFPMSYSHETGLVYIPVAVQAGPFLWNRTSGYEGEDSPLYGLGYKASVATKLYADTVFDPHPDAPKPGQASGRLLAWDPVAQEKVWEVEHELHYNGGLLSTASGLLMQGDATGLFSIRDASNGELIWQFDVRSGVIASPVTYLVDGEQYVTIAVGWGGGRGQTRKAVERLHPGTIYTFRLGGDADAPPKLPPVATPLTTMRSAAEPEAIGQGYNLFTGHCVGCHTNPGSGGGAIPDLVHSPMLAAFDSVVLEGALASQGMPGFGDLLGKEDLAAILDYLLYTAESLANEVPAKEYYGELARMQYLADQQ